jgi:hypothetical protein
MSASPRIAARRGARAATKRKGRGKAAHSLKLIAAAADILAAIQPATVRAVCYQLFIQGVIASMAKSETNRVSVQLTDAREQGLIPWESIVDETRETEYPFNAWDDLSGYLDTVSNAYARDRWTRQPNRVEVWSEKNTVAGTLRPILRKYGVPFLPLRGFNSATKVHDAAVNSANTSQNIIKLYVGDYDPSGMYMSEKDLPERLDRYSERRDRDSDKVDLRRIALTKLHCQSLGRGLSFPVDSKKDDTRYAWFKKGYGSRCWELDALSPAMLRVVVEREIRALINRDIWKRDDRAEKAELRSIREVISDWPSIPGQARKYAR